MYCIAINVYVYCIFARRMDDKAFKMSNAGHKKWILDVLPVKVAYFRSAFVEEMEFRIFSNL